MSEDKRPTLLSKEERDMLNLRILVETEQITPIEASREIAKILHIDDCPYPTS